MITRRDLLLARSSGPRVLALSGERLYMRYVDARVDGTTAELFDAIEEELRQVDEVRLSQPAWLTATDVAPHFDRVFDAFHARGGRISFDS